MFDTGKYREQHKELQQLIRKIASAIKLEQIAKDASDTASLIAGLGAKVKVHLAMEDDYLYPRLLKQDDDDILETTQRYIDEINDINDTLNYYLGKWGSPSSIQGKPKEFILESQDIFKKMMNRFDREEQELYPIIEQIG